MCLSFAQLCAGDSGACLQVGAASSFRFMCVSALCSFAKYKRRRCIAAAGVVAKQPS